MLRTYDIAGKIIYSNEQGIKGVYIYYSLTEYMLSDENGDWSIPSLIGEYSIAPKMANFSFNPESIVVSAKNENLTFIATSKLIDYETLIHNWFNNMQMNNGLLSSTENGDVVSLYDNALAALVYIMYDDYERAEKVFDFFMNRIDSEFLGSTKKGFSQFRDRNGTPNNHRWMGDNAWLLIALNNYKKVTGKSTYNRLLNEIETWLYELQNTNTGAVMGGYSAEDKGIGENTEGNIDAFNAVTGYTNFHQRLLDFLKNYRWDASEHSLLAWPGDVYQYALDIHPWSYCTFEDFPLTTLHSADRFLTTKVATATKQTVKGYCFDIDKDVIWIEGTGEMVVAFNEAGLTDKADYYLKEIEKTFIKSSIYTEAGGMPYTINPGTGYGGDYEWNQLWEGVDINPVVSSSAWYLFGKNNFNPFKAGGTKNISTADKFWIN